MRRWIYCLLLPACFASMQGVAQSLVGTYKLVSFAVEIDGQAPVEMFGKAPRGMVVFTPTRVISLTTAEKRKFGTSTEEKAALWDSLISYAGPYRLEGDKIITSVDISWNESWNGTQVTRHWRQDGNLLHISTAKAPYSRDPSRMAVGRIVLERVE